MVGVLLQLSTDKVNLSHSLWDQIGDNLASVFPALLLTIKCGGGKIVSLMLELTWQKTTMLPHAQKALLQPLNLIPVLSCFFKL